MTAIYDDIDVSIQEGVNNFNLHFIIYSEILDEKTDVQYDADPTLLTLN